MYIFVNKVITISGYIFPSIIFLSGLQVDYNKQKMVP